MTYIVALTGGIASGKTTVSGMFERRGVPIIDADIIARQIVEPGSFALQRIKQKLGATICLPDGKLNRQQLRAKIVSNLELKQWLENLLHPLIQQQTHQQLQAVSAPFCLWVVPLLLENQLQEQADRILVTDIPETLQIRRTIERDGVSEEQARAIIKLQVSREQRLAIADDVIATEGSLSLVEEKVEQLYQNYIQYAVEKGKYDAP
jgi:dephospho-CoA kinase